MTGLITMSAAGVKKQVKTSYWLFIPLIILVTALPYRTLLFRGYSDPDDFKEVRRALTNDLSNPEDIFLTSHEGNRYRPMNRLLTALTAWVGNGEPSWFLLRKLVFHLVNAILVFKIIRHIIDAGWLAVIGAIFFGLHPANTNSVSIAVFEQAPGTTAILLASNIVITQMDREKTANFWSLFLATLLILFACLVSEMFLWGLPIFTLLMFFCFYKFGQSTQFLKIFLITLLITGIYVVVRQSIVEETSVLAQSTSSRYGFQGFKQVFRNYGMFIVSSNVVIDYLHFIEPRIETLPTSMAAFTSKPFLSLSLLFAGGLFTLTIVSAAILLFLKRSRVVIIANIFLALFFFSVSIVAITTTASETHLYPGNAFLVIAQILLLRASLKFFQGKLQPGYVKFIHMVTVIFLATIMLGRFYGTEYRNNILDAKAKDIGYLQNQLAHLEIDPHIKRLVFIPTCKLKPGFSVYGGLGIGAVWGGVDPFVKHTLHNPNLNAKIIKPELQNLEKSLLKDTESRFLFVDDDAVIYSPPKTESYDCINFKDR